MAASTDNDAPPADSQSRWRPTPRRFALLMFGLVLFGLGEACVVHAGLGNSPWSVLAEGVADRSPLEIGGTTVALSAVVLLIWVPLRQRPGLGTVANAVVVGVVLGAALPLLPGVDGIVARALVVLGGIGLVGLGSGLYLGAAMGAGPRDGLMTGLHRVTGVQVSAVRGAIELTVTAAGAALGGTVGFGTLAFAVLVGPAVAAALMLLSTTPTSEL